MGGEDVSTHKPDPSGLLSAARKLGYSCSETLYVGDSTVDAETAKSADTNKINGMLKVSLLSTIDYTPKEGSIIALMYTAINDDMCSTVEEVLNYVVLHYKKPRSDKPVTSAFVGSSIKWCVTNNKLKLEE